MRRYVLVWTIDGELAGAFCPAGGLTADEAERAIDRLDAAIVTSPDFRAGTQGEVETKLVPYVFDVREAFKG